MSVFDSEWQARFERFGRTYADEARVSGWSPAGLERRVALFRALVPSLEVPAGSLVLDLGCGAGTYVRLLAGEGYRAYGIDYSRPTLARAVAADPGSPGRYLAGEGYALPFRAGSLSLIVSIGVLQAVSEPRRALAEMVRVLRPGGGLVIEALNRRALPTRAASAVAALRRQPPRVRAYDPREVAGWLAALGVDVLRRAGLCLPPRRLPGLAPLLDRPMVRRAIDRSPALAEAAAHAFLFAGRKIGRPVGSAA